MATGKQALRLIQDAAEAAGRHYPGEREMRLEAFVCYLSGALKSPHANAAPLAELVFSLLQDNPLPATTPEADKP